MPVHKTKGGYKYGNTGKTYSDKKKAIKQAIAIAYSKARKEGRDPTKEEIEQEITGTPDEKMSKKANVLTAVSVVACGRLLKNASMRSEHLGDGIYFEYDDKDLDSANSLALIKKNMEPATIGKRVVNSLPAATIAALIGGVGSMLLSRGSLAAGGVGAAASGLSTLALNTIASEAPRPTVWDAISSLKDDQLAGNWKLTDKPRVQKRADGDSIMSNPTAQRIALGGGSALLTYLASSLFDKDNEHIPARIAASLGIGGLVGATAPSIVKAFSPSTSTTPAPKPGAPDTNPKPQAPGNSSQGTQTPVANPQPQPNPQPNPQPTPAPAAPQKPVNAAAQQGPQPQPQTPLQQSKQPPQPQPPQQAAQAFNTDGLVSLIDNPDYSTAFTPRFEAAARQRYGLAKDAPVSPEQIQEARQQYLDTVRVANNLQDPNCANARVRLISDVTTEFSNRVNQWRAALAEIPGKHSADYRAAYAAWADMCALYGEAKAMGYRDWGVGPWSNVDGRSMTPAEVLNMLNTMAHQVKTENENLRARLVEADRRYIEMDRDDARKGRAELEEARRSARNF